MGRMVRIRPFARESMREKVTLFVPVGSGGLPGRAVGRVPAGLVGV